MSVQVREGWDTPGGRAQDLAEQTPVLLTKLIRDLRQSARWMRNGNAILVRMVYLDSLVSYTQGRVTWSMGVSGYRDLQEISSLYVAMGNHDGMVARICEILRDIDEYHHLTEASYAA